LACGAKEENPMRAWMLLVVLLFGVLFGAVDAIACQHDFDCDQGSHCVIQDGRNDGVCVNDTPNAPIDEQETVETPPIDDDSEDGAACRTHEDCGVGGRCVNGVCKGGM
jgi:hypothetical protein